MHIVSDERRVSTTTLKEAKYDSKMLWCNQRFMEYESTQEMEAACPPTTQHQVF